MRRSFLNKMVDYDMFGYPVSMFYHRDSKVKNSPIGLLVTTFMFCVGLAYFT